MVLDLEEVRSLATSHNYQEIQHNPTSRVIIFRSNGGGSMQINVYYTTGTVGTCLNHPKQGKTQLFRRGVVHLDPLSDIFQNPRIHTGVGYKLRKNMNMWQPATATATGNNQHIYQQEQEAEAECDLVRRWRYVCAAMDLGDSLSSQRVDDNDNNDEARILRFCKLWNALEFPASVDSSREKNRRTGAACVLFDLLIAAAKKYHQVGAVYMTYENDEYNREPRLFHIDELMNCICEDGVQFASQYSSELMEASALLGEFNSSKTREELLLWFFSRMSPGDNLVRILVEEDHDNNAVAAADPQPEFMNIREDMDMIHREYSKLYYLKKSKMCLCHGYTMEKE